MASEQRSAPRIARACGRCRSRKVRCNGHAPCSACLPGGHSCIYRQSSRHRRRRHQQVPSPSSQLPLASPTPLPTLRPPHTLHDPAQFKRHKELRAGIGVSNVDTGSFHFYGNCPLSPSKMASLTRIARRPFVSFLFYPAHVSADDENDK